ncbi:MAG: polyprenyl synthetase family protein [Thermomicrobiales bacterium]|jgi:geranylgeranyl diphosphate synthase type I|nr:polyprenyl synthetase family protein [Thermomicrobiales bacterium]
MGGQPGLAEQRHDQRATATLAARRAAIEAVMRQEIERVQQQGAGDAGLDDCYGMLRYHLGWADASFAPAQADGGKLFRPLLLVRCAEACGANPNLVLSAAAAVELLHNFTLVHDDIQDESSHRRHRETIWHRWGTAAALNVGDALYAAAHAALYRLAAPPANVPPGRVLAVAREFDRTALRIIEGQHLDLSHEGRWDCGIAGYLTMIEGKTAALIRFAARAGALIAGADDAMVVHCGRFGLALGLAFQVRDDILGVWGTPEQTGKPVGDDIRRRKQSLPIVVLDKRADPASRAELHALYAAPTLDDAGVARVLALLDAAGSAARCQDELARYLAEARAELAALACPELLHEFLDALAPC